MLGALQILSHLILTTSLWGKYSYSNFANKKTGSERLRKFPTSNNLQRINLHICMAETSTDVLLPLIWLGKLDKEYMLWGEGLIRRLWSCYDLLYIIFIQKRKESDDSLYLRIHHRISLSHSSSSALKLWSEYVEYMQVFRDASFYHMRCSVNSL